MTTFKERVMSLWPDLSVAKVSDLIGMSHMGLSKVFRNGSIPKAETLLSIHEKTGCDLKWLMTGEGQPFPMTESSQGGFPVAVSSGAQVLDTLGNEVDISEFVFIPRYNVQASAGNGLNAEGEKPRFSMAFRIYWVKNYLNANPQDLAVISVKGDSMEGVLNERDNILINCGKNKPGNGLYVVRIGNDLIVKRIQSMPGGKLLVTSANEAYAPFEIDAHQEYEDIAIIGKVEWFGRQI